MWQRMGRKLPASETPPLWFHCASVGEVKAASPLIRAFHDKHPDTPIVLTTGTPTSAVIHEQTLTDISSHVYLPFDTSGGVKRFLERTRPKGAIIFETEIWPTLFATCKAQGVPLIIVNGRLSPKTLNAAGWIRGIYAHTLQFVDAVLARSKEDANSFEELGLDARKTEIIGNIKFAALPHKGAAELSDLISRPYWLAASTHQGEEALLAQAQQNLQSSTTPLLVIAPRHPKRLNDIEPQIEKTNLPCAVRSRGEPIHEETQIYIADTLGELDALIAHAELVFMGGSMVNVGGHNLLEPAALGKAIITGPHLHNFKEEAHLLSSNEAMLIAQNPTELETLVEQQLKNPEECRRLGMAAEKTIAGNGDVLNRYLIALERLIPL